MTAPHDTDLAVLDVAGMAAADRAAIAAGTPGIVLMERAGRAVADTVDRRTPPGARILVLCGPGNNGGDGFVAARLLVRRGRPVTLALAGERDALTGDAATAAEAWTGPIEPIAAVRPEAHGIVVDALFGAGLNRPLEGAVAELVAGVNAADKPIVAVDVPSGLSGDTGRSEGPVIRATETVTFFRLKPGHLLLPGRTLCGIVTLADIGIRSDFVFTPERPATLFRNAPALWRDHWPVHDVETHKYRRGAVLVVAGGIEGVGAPRLGARAALRVGAGLATIACRPEALAAHAARGPDALMQRAADNDGLVRLLSSLRLSSVLIGPALGLDATAREAVAAVLDSPVPAVLDADALTLIASAGAAFSRRLARRGGPCVLTPHEGEFARLFGDAGGGSKLQKARAAAFETGAVIVLKGPDTVIASPDGRASINVTGSPALATAGSGDVLGGLVAGLLAQGMPAFEAACAAVWLHGRAGEERGAGLIADDLPEAVPALLGEAAGS